MLLRCRYPSHANALPYSMLDYLRIISQISLSLRACMPLPFQNAHIPKPCKWPLEKRISSRPSRISLSKPQVSPFLISSLSSHVKKSTCYAIPKLYQIYVKRSYTRPSRRKRTLARIVRRKHRNPRHIITPIPITKNRILVTTIPHSHKPPQSLRTKFTRESSLGSDLKPTLRRCPNVTPFSFQR